jgi:DNA-binding helix-hairpin-helix protein with protein kinase domain
MIRHAAITAYAAEVPHPSVGDRIHMLFPHPAILKILACAWAGKAFAVVLGVGLWEWITAHSPLAVFAAIGALVGLFHNFAIQWKVTSNKAHILQIEDSRRASEARAAQRIDDLRERLKISEDAASAAMIMLEREKELRQQDMMQTNEIQTDMAIMAAELSKLRSRVRRTETDIKDSSHTLQVFVDQPLKSSEGGPNAGS